MAIVLGVIIAVIAIFVLRKRDIVTHDPLSGAAGPAPAGVDISTVTKEILALMEKGDTISAIKVYRQATGTDLLTAKNFVEKMAKLGGMPPGGLEAAPKELAPGGPELAEVRALVKAGKLIDAVKRYRELAGCGLYEAKQAVDRIAAEP